MFNSKDIEKTKRAVEEWSKKRFEEKKQEEVREMRERMEKVATEKKKKEEEAERKEKEEKEERARLFKIRTQPPTAPTTDANNNAIGSESTTKRATETAPRKIITPTKTTTSAKKQNPKKTINAIFDEKDTAKSRARKASYKTPATCMKDCEIRKSCADMIWFSSIEEYSNKEIEEWVTSNWSYKWLVKMLFFERARNSYCCHFFSNIHH